MSSKLTHLLVFTLLLLLSGLARAEGNCPEGYYPIGGGSPGAPQGCAPIPGADGNQGQQGQQSQPSPQWAAQSGAIATDPKKGVLGTAVNMESKAFAERAALAECKSKGGTACQLDVTYTNGCAAMVAGDAAYKASSASTMDEAVDAATKICTGMSTGCHVYYSACSLPRKVR